MTTHATIPTHAAVRRPTKSLTRHLPAAALIKGTEACVGALLLTNRFVPLALTVFAPVLINILAFHAFLAASGIGPGLALTVLELYLAWTYRAAYQPLLATRAAAGGE